MPDPLQVLVKDSGAPRLVAGLPACLRAAHRAAADLAPAKLVICGNPPDFPHRYERQLGALASPPAPCADGEAAGKFLSASAPLLVLAGDGFPRDGALARFVAQARAGARPARWVSGGLAVAAYFPRAGDLFGGAETAAAAAQRALRDPGAFLGVQANGDWLAAGHPEAAERAEAALLASLSKDTDGYIARFDRRISTAVSRLLLKTPVTPNQITSASLALGLAGAWALASASRLEQFLGALVLWVCCILDGCDGEVARLKLLCSPEGAAFDLWADELAHLATFVAIPIGVYRLAPGRSLLLPGALLVSGFLGCGLAVWRLILSRPEERRGPHSLLVERIASRDYVYLIVLLTALGRMEWFLWGAAFGTHVFWLGLIWLSRRPAPAIPAPTTLKEVS